MKRTITINSNELDKSIKTKQILSDKLQQAGFFTSDKIQDSTELIVSIGGDGSFLKTVNDFDFPDIPIIVINTGHLGFFAELDPGDIDEFIEDYKNEKCFIQEVYPLRASVCTKEKCTKIEAINEVVIKSVCSRTLHLDLKVNENKIQKFSGDGMLVSTPIGSTAYNYSAGGSIIDPSLDTLQLTPLAPMNTIAYRSFTSSIILSATSTISIIPEYRFENSILIVVDGVEYKFNDIEDISIQRSNIKIKLLRRSNYEFWKRVSEKFL